VRIVLGTEGLTGHALPALALGRELHRRGHDVLLCTSRRWAEEAAALGIRFEATPERLRPLASRSAPGSPPTVVEGSQRLLPILADFRPDVVVCDLFTLGPALAAEAAGVARASLVPHVYTVQEPGLPFYLQGLRPPRGRLGRAAWRAVGPARLPVLMRGRRELNRLRRELGLEPQTRFHGALSDRLVLVATFPQLEYPRRWPEHVHVTGPMFFELAGPEFEPPRANRPLVLVASSTSQDPRHRLVATALEALAHEPVEVLAVTNRRGETYSGRVPANATVFDWVSYGQAMRCASAVVCHGGHGTVAAALAAGAPVVVCPAGGDQAENGARVAWAGAGVMLPKRLLAAAPLRWSVRRILADQRFRERAQALAAWSDEHDGTERAAGLVEALASAPA
jgi:MGT family glycosyltransferase